MPQQGTFASLNMGISPTKIADCLMDCTLHHQMTHLGMDSKDEHKNQMDCERDLGDHDCADVLCTPLLQLVHCRSHA